MEGAEEGTDGACGEAGCVRADAGTRTNALPGCPREGPDGTGVRWVQAWARKWACAAEEVARNVFARPALSESVKEAVEGIVGHMINL